MVPRTHGKTGMWRATVADPRRAHRFAKPSVVSLHWRAMRVTSSGGSWASIFSKVSEVSNFEKIAYRMNYRRPGAPGTLSCGISRHLQDLAVNVACLRRGRSRCSQEEQEGQGAPRDRRVRKKKKTWPCRPNTYKKEHPTKPTPHTNGYVSSTRAVWAGNVPRVLTKHSGP